MDKCCKYILWDTLCTLSPFSWASVLLLPVLTDAIVESANCISIHFSSSCLYVLSICYLLQYDGRLIINVSRCKCKLLFFFFSVFDMEVFTKCILSILSRGINVRMASRKSHILLFPFFEQLVQGVFCSRGISLHVEKAVAVCILANGSAHYHVQYKSEIGLVRSEQREMLFYEMDAISLKVLRVWSNLGYVI